MQEWRRCLTSAGVVPVIVLDDVSTAVPLGDALVAGSVPVAEVTLRTAAAIEAIACLSRNPQLFVGAGTVITADQVNAAVEAGARFIVSPGLSSAVVSRALELGVPVIPGVVTASEVMRALDLGVDLLKFFPAGPSGGPAAVKALRSPFTNVQFIPTGGVGQHNMADYLRLPNVAAVGGSWMVRPELVAARDFAQVTALCRKARALALSTKVEAA